MPSVIIDTRCDEKRYYGNTIGILDMKAKNASNAKCKRGEGRTAIIGTGSGRTGGGLTPTGIARSAGLEAALSVVWGEIASLEMERLVVLDRDGNRIFEKDGTESNVSIAPEESKMLRGSVVMHNHPEQDGARGLPATFSSADLKTAIAFRQSEENVCNPSTMASFQLLPTSALRRRFVRMLFLRPLTKIGEEMNEGLMAVVDLFEQGSINYDQTVRDYRDISEKGINKVRHYLRENQTRYGYIYEERMWEK
jgi:hypothetical protein